LREALGIDRDVTALPVVALEFERATARLLRFVGNDVVVDERQPESATRAAGLEVGPAAHERVANVGRGPDVEFRADDVAAPAGGDERRTRDEQSREDDRDSRGGDQLCVGRA
jgi:hypothetical protein